jgi:hypothetical protein
MRTAYQYMVDDLSISLSFISGVSYIHLVILCAKRILWHARVFVRSNSIDNLNKNQIHLTRSLIVQRIDSQEFLTQNSGDSVAAKKLF